MSAANARIEQSSLIHDGGGCCAWTSSPRYGRSWTPTWAAAALCATPLWPACPTSVRHEGDAPQATRRERSGGRRPLVPAAAGTTTMVTLRSGRSLRILPRSFEEYVSCWSTGRRPPARVIPLLDPPSQDVYF
jgi:hypothetical protein